MKRQVGLFVAGVASGFVIGGSAFAGQLNALGQWVPTSTEEGRSGWTAAGPTVEAVAGAEASRLNTEAAGFVTPRRETRYRLDALGREVPIQTNLP